MRFRKQSGVALIITLIMLSVITVMAVAFLALSRRERASVVHSANAIDAELMASAGLERAKAEILGNIISQSNFLGPDFLVSGARTNTPPVPFLYGDPIYGPDPAGAKQQIWSLVNGSHPPVFI